MRDTGQIVRTYRTNADEQSANRNPIRVVLLILSALYFTSIGNSILLAALSVAICIMALFEDHRRINLCPRVLIAVMALFLLTMLSIGLSPYSHVMTLSMAINIATLLLLTCLVPCSLQPSSIKPFYLLSSLVLVVTFAVYVVRPETFELFGGVYRPGSASWSPLLLGANDKNRTAIFVFLFLCLSWKVGGRFGIALGLVYPCLYFGRQYIVMLVVLFSSWLAMRVLCIGDDSTRSKKGRAIDTMPLFAAFVVSTALIACFSYYWTEVVIPSGVGSYKASLNDASNASRMASNVYALQRIASRPLDFLLYGYDSDIYDQLGISSIDFSTEANYQLYGLYRLVQPHEEVINTLLKTGLSFTVVYYGLVSYLISKLANSRQDVAILTSYFVGSLFLHQMFTMQNLALLCCVLSVEPMWQIGSSRGHWAPSGTPTVIEDYSS